MATPDDPNDTTTPIPAWSAHDSAVIDPGAQIGYGTRIWHFSHVCAGAVIGAGCSFGQNTFVADRVVVGDRVKVQNNVSLYEGVIVEDDVFLGPSCVLTNVFNPRSHVSRRHEYRPTIIRRGATIGANATVVCGVEIGRYAFVGAGAVVTRDVVPFAQVVGSPARTVGWRCQCGERLAGAGLEPGSQVACAACGARYDVGDDGAPVWLDDPHVARP
jgi:UDP-2-acetamido-3-amino-2,3-dideoxy-glucuronate N-acetyltransferase